MSKPIAIITGAVGGIGLACVEQMSKNYALVLSDVSETKLNTLARRLRQSKITVQTLVSDISKQEDVTALVSLAASCGTIDVLIHTAGISPMMAEGKRILTINLLGTDYLLEVITPYMSNGAAAVCIASQAGTFARVRSNPQINALLEEPTQVHFFEKLLEAGGDEALLSNAYGFSKLGVQLLVQKYAPIWGSNNARINSISPGIIDTPMGRLELEKQPVAKIVVDSTPLSRTGKPEEIANVAAFLASDAASFITGCDLLVDGGSTHNVMRLINSGQLIMPARKNV